MHRCVICGRPSVVHHLVFGWSLRTLANEDKLIIELCDYHHNLGGLLERIHGNPMAEELSKMLGEMMYERNYIAKVTDREDLIEEARESFRNRYGRNYLGEG